MGSHDNATVVGRTPLGAAICSKLDVRQPWLHQTFGSPQMRQEAPSQELVKPIARRISAGAVCGSPAKGQEPVLRRLMIR